MPAPTYPSPLHNLGQIADAYSIEMKRANRRRSGSAGSASPGSDDTSILVLHRSRSLWRNCKPRFLYARRTMRNAVKGGILIPDGRFGLHSLKHGVSPIQSKKKEARGHKTDAMLHLYDHSLPLVERAGTATGD